MLSSSTFIFRLPLLTHLRLMDFPFPINWTCQFPILGLLGGIFHLCSKFEKNLLANSGKPVATDLVFNCLPLSHKDDDMFSPRQICPF